jgi:hypothetical protein
MSSSPEGQLGTQAFGFGISLANVGLGLLGFLGIIASLLPILVVGFVVAMVTIPWVNYQHTAMSEVDHFMRASVFPVWRDVVRPVANLVRRAVNPLLCWFNAFNWWAYGIVYDVLIPTALECGGGQLFVKAGAFLNVLLKDCVADHLLTLEFMDRPFNFTRVCTAQVEFVEAWIEFYTCACMDLADLLGAWFAFFIPNINFMELLFNPFMMPLVAIPNIFSRQWADPQFCCYIWNIISALLNLLGIAIRLVIQIIQALLVFIAPQSPSAQVSFTRPNFYDATELLCEARRCYMRSFENTIQRAWDMYVPFKFNWHNYLCAIDQFHCFFLKTVNWVLTLLINIDKVVQYPSDPFWQTDMLPLTIENLNLLAAPTNFPIISVPGIPMQPERFKITSFFLNTSEPNTPAGTFNPVFGTLRLDECICNFITRTICDPSDEDTACFDVGAQNLMQGFDFCCATNVLLGTAVDATASLAELSYHLATGGGDDFFLYMDRQPYTHAFKERIVDAVRCVLGVLTLIPEVGAPLRNLVVSAARYVVCLAEFLLRVLLALTTLPYFVTELPSIPNFLQTTNKAVDEWVAFHEDLVRPNAPTSFQNSLCLLLNKGFPVPPIPCGACVAGGFLPVGQFEYARNATRDPRGISRGGALQGKMAALMGRLAHRVTPMLHYGSENTTRRANPIALAQQVWANARDASTALAAPFGVSRGSPHVAVDAYITRKRDEIRARFLEARAPTVNGRCAALFAQNLDRRLDAGEPTFDSEGFIVERLTLAPTSAPVSSCANPVPACFDLCCLFRATLEVAVHLLQFSARFFNGLIQGMQQPGALQDFPYFTGEACDRLGQDCFETDVVTFILLLFKIPECLCEFLNLIIPVTDFGRPDVCCAIQRLSELLACIFQVIYNSISSLALGSSTNPPFMYFVDGLFLRDVDTLFDITLELIVCICVLVRAVFPLAYIPGFNEAVNFDICCIAMVWLDTLVEILRLLVTTIISLATITVTPDSFCYFRLDTTNGCGGTLDEIGFVKQVDVILDTLLPRPDSQCMNTCCHDQGLGGITTCVCQLFNTLLPARNDPSKPVNCTVGFENCQLLDFCCPVVRTGFLFNDAGKFTIRALAAVWQSWVPGPSGLSLPEFFINYIFCDEQRDSNVVECNSCTFLLLGNDTGFTNPMKTNCQCGTYTCGKLFPVLDDLVGPNGLILCLCEYLRFVDDLLELFFDLLGTQWFRCFCGSQFGVLNGVSNLANQIVTTLLELVRKFPLECYWNPSTAYTYNAMTGMCQFGTALGFGITSFEQTWIFQFLAPTGNAACILLGNLSCFLNAIFNLDATCMYGPGTKFLGSLVRWVFEVVIRVIGFIEGFVLFFATPTPTCIGTNSSICAAQDSGVTAFQVQQSALSRILNSLLATPIDLFIGDSIISCSTICPRDSLKCALNAADVCACYMRSPIYQGWDAGGMPVWTPVFNPFASSYPAMNDANTQIANALMANTTPPFQGLSTSYVCVFGGGAVSGNFNFLNQDFMVGDELPQCIADTELEIDDPRYNLTCSYNNVCRPDTLPTCSVSCQDTDFMTTTQALQTGYEGSVDGVFMGLIRYIACALDSLIDGFGVILRPLVIIMSVVWQLMGGVIAFITACLLFLLTLFKLTAGCECFEGVDALQANITYDYVKDIMVGLQTYSNTGAIKYAQVGALCYKCPFGETADCGCNDVAQSCQPNDFLCQFNTPPRPYQCERHCPVYTGNVTDPLLNCIAILSKFPTSVLRFPDNVTHNCAGSPGLDDAISCGASFGADNVLTANQYPAYCPAPYCQVGSMQAEWPVCGYTTLPFKTSCCGCVYNDAPLPLCSVFTLVSAFFNVINSFIAIFTTRIWIPNSRRGVIDPLIVERPTGPVRRESMEQYVRRMDEHTHAQRSNADASIPSPFEVILRSMYDFDNSDCMTDPVKCGCRNFHMPEHCRWDPATDSVVVTPTRRVLRSTPYEHIVKRDGDGVALYQREMIPNEMLELVGERFDGDSECDMNVHDCQQMDWETLPHLDKNAWYGCVTKRMVSERAYALAPQTIPKNVMYTDRAPLTVFENIVSNAQQSLEREHREEIKKRDESRKRLARAFPDMDTQLRERRKSAVRRLVRMGADPAILNALADADQIYFKYQSGFYGHVYGEFKRKLRTGDLHWPTKLEALADMRRALGQLRHTIVMAPYGEFADSVLRVAEMGRTLVERVTASGGLSQFASETLADIKERHYRNVVVPRQERRAVTWARIQRWPLYRWFWETPSNTSSSSSFYTRDGETIWDDRGEPVRRGLAGFVQHLGRVWRHQREHWQEVRASVWTADLSARSAWNRLVSRWTTPRWTPEKLENWRSVQRVAYRAYDAAYPHALTREEKERFIFNGNCLIMDRVLNLTLRVVDYCANDYAFNMRNSTPAAVRAYLEQTSRFRENVWHNHHNARRYEIAAPRTRAHPAGDPDAWARPRFLLASNETGLFGRTAHARALDGVDRRAYKRAVALTGPANFNFNDYVTERLEDLFSYMFNTQAETWVNTARAWIANPRSEESDWPDVGGIYWVKFMFRCEFPENLDCSRGIGLEPALIWVTVGVVGALIVGTFVFPPIAMLLSVVPAFLLWAALVGVIGLHYSPRCAVLMPTITGISITVPTCILDELLALADKYITNCYAGLLYPASLVSGEACPTDPNQYVDFVSCKNVGVSDGLQHILFLGFIALGQAFMDVILVLLQSTVGLFVPGVERYVRITIGSFRDAGDTMRERQWWCFGLTLPAIVLPVVLLIVFAVLFGFVLPLVLDLVFQSVILFQATPAVMALPGEDGAWDDPSAPQE